MPSNQDNPEILQVIESALELSGKGSKQIILDYLNVRYGMNRELIVQYKDEFENYLRETLGDSAEIIISKIDENLYKKSTTTNNNNHNDDNDVAAAHEQKRSRGRTQNGRIADVVHFLICDKCFWCASILKERYESKCMSCGSQIVSAVPVMGNEMFVVEVDKKRGISLSFR
jgi:hypothetical protein